MKEDEVAVHSLGILSEQVHEGKCFDCGKGYTGEVYESLLLKVASQEDAEQIRGMCPPGSAIVVADEDNIDGEGKINYAVKILACELHEGALYFLNNSLPSYEWRDDEEWKIISQELVDGVVHRKKPKTLALT